MNAFSRYNALLYLAVLLGTMTFLTADEKPLMFLIALPALVIGYLTSRPPAPAPRALPRSAIDLLVLAAIVNAAVRVIAVPTGDPIVSTLGQFLLLLGLIKLFDRRTSRDDKQLLQLSVFMVIAAVLTSNSFLVGVQLLLFMPVCAASTMYWQIVAGSRADSGGSLAPVADAVSMPADPRARRSFFRLCTVIVLVCCTVAAFVFVLTPRGIGGDVLGRLGATRDRQIGFTEEVKLGSAGMLSDNPQPVLDLSITTFDGEKIGSAQQTIYLRGAARDTYQPEPMQWADSTRHGAVPSDTINPYVTHILPARDELDSPEGGPGGPWRAPDRSASLRIQRITMRGTVETKNIFALWRPISITPDRAVRLSVSPRNRTIRQVVETPGEAGRLSYTVESLVAEEPGPPPRVQLGFAKGPIRELAVQVLKDRGADAPDSTSRQVANAIRDHLRTRYEYTLEMVAPPPDTDAIEFFLFQNKRGHCEYFASAMAAMCQSVGTPARVVVGYVATEFNPITGQYLVRQSNAHAWVEAFLVTDLETGYGRWETFDPSPPADIERIHRPPAGLLAQLRSWYDAIEVGWSNSIIGFDNLKQSRLFGRDTTSAVQMPRRIDEIAERVALSLKTLGRDRRALARLWSGIFAALAVGIAVYAVFRWGGLSLKRVKKNRRSGVRFYDDALRALRKAGIPKPESRAALDHARAVEAFDPALGASWRALAERYYQLRFAGRDLSDHDHSAIVNALRALRARAAALKRRPKTPPAQER